MRIVTRQGIALGKVLDGSGVPDRPALAWLGQAGFVICYKHLAMFIAPYLSNSLGVKYRGTLFPHTRMMPPPLAPEQIQRADWVFCTHAHTDHMDPGTLAIIAQRNPQCRFVVPRACLMTATERGVPPDRSIGMTAGDTLAISTNITGIALASAHEELAVDQHGDCLFLGYVLRFPGATLYHSGDCVPYERLPRQLASLPIDVAILPVNGRDRFRRENGVPGNFTFDEAVALCKDAGIPSMIACHFGMLEFNTVDIDSLDRQIAGAARNVQCIRPRLGEIYELD